jgi:hypothetical protein
LDIIAGNWGLNHRFRTTAEHPRKLYFGQLGGRGGVDLIEAYYADELGKEVPERGFREVSAALPFILERVQTFRAYGKAGLEDLMGERLKKAKALHVTTLSSSVFINRDMRFEQQVLPQPAQFSPAIGVCAGDMDGDGNEDIFLSQNFFATHPTSSRNDAGRGLWLKGDGTGAFRPLSGQESGVRVYGEQRGCALADYDADGRLDLVVTQNGNATRLFRNDSGKPGLRVRLNAGPENPTGVGSVLRVRVGDRLGPAREVHAGGGYWSQDSAVQVMGTGGKAAAIWVRWAGGKTGSYDVPPNAREVEIALVGGLRVIR